MNFSHFARQAARGVVLLSFCLATAAAGCEGSDGDGGDGDGGGSACSGASCGCRQSDCGDDERCVQDECRSACLSQDDCPLGQNCVTWGFADGDQGDYCAVLDYAADGRTGQYEACDEDEECDALRGFSCVAGECGVPCRSHFDCAALGHCAGGSAGARACAPGEPQAPGHYYTHCPYSDPDCDVSAGFFCRGAGVGDLEAYCSADCTSDADCPIGFQCDAILASPCANACGILGDATDPSCVPSAQIGDAGPYHCGMFGVTRNACARRDFCSPCETDADCLALPDQICAKDESGASICTQECDPTVDSCPWGNATKCGLWDEESGLYTCAHRFGSCRGTGLGCEPCVVDSDCGDRGICRRLAFTGERHCIDLTVTCDCGADADASGLCTGHGCPETPGGLPMLCGADSQVCLGASTSESLAASPQIGCWRP